MTLLEITIAAILTLFVYGYLSRDNALYRIASHLLVGISVAYALTVAVHDVLLPRLLLPLQATVSGSQSRQDLLIPLVLGILLLATAVPVGSRLGNIPLAMLMGVGIGVSVGGALVGTLVPQLRASMLPVAPVNGVGVVSAILNGVLILALILAFLSFRYSRQAGTPTVDGSNVAAAESPSLLFHLGRWVLMVTFGAILGGTILTCTAVLVGRWDFLINDWLMRFVQ